MPDMSLIAGAVTSLRMANDIAKGLVAIRDEQLRNEKVIELQRIILSAQSDALSAQSDQLSLLQQIGDLEKEITSLKAWETEKDKYELNDVGHGAFAYVRKKDARPPEQPHWLCTNCYQSGKKSILLRGSSAPHVALWKCPGCSAQITVGGRISPSNPTGTQLTKLG